MVPDSDSVVLDSDWAVLDSDWSDSLEASSLEASLDSDWLDSVASAEVLASDWVALLAVVSLVLEVSEVLFESLSHVTESDPFSELDSSLRPGFPENTKARIYNCTVYGLEIDTI